MQKEYFKELDVMRFFAFAMVFVAHVAMKIFVDVQSPVLRSVKSLFLINGDIGVNFFFTLSGFLITYLLIKEKLKHKTVHIKKFFMRRALRIWPVYFLTVATTFFIFPLETVDFSQLPWFLLFLANFGLDGGQGNFTSGVLWSISVEEQFYLLWPWIILFVPLRYLPKVFAGIIALSTLHRFMYSPDFSIIQYSTFSVVSSLVIGAWFAYLALMSPKTKEFFQKSSSWLFYVPLLIVLALLPFNNLMDYLIDDHELAFKFISAIFPLIFSLLFAVIISTKSFGKKDSEGECEKPSLWNNIFVYLGTISYGLYCYHAIVILAVKEFGPEQHIAQAVVAFILTVIFASISFHIMEKPILALKKRFEA